MFEFVVYNEVLIEDGKESIDPRSSILVDV